MLITSPTPAPALVSMAFMQSQMLPLIPAEKDVWRRLKETSLAFASSDGLGRPPWIQKHTEILHGRGGVQLDLRRWPVLEVLEVLVRGQAEAASQVVGERRDTLYLAGGWPKSRSLPGASPGTGDRELDIQVTYRAGWVVPDQVYSWAALQTVEAGSWTEVNGSLFEAATGGSKGTVEPTWPLAGEEVQDGDVLWRSLPAETVPLDLRAAAVLHAKQLLTGQHDVPPHVARIGDASSSISFSNLSFGRVQQASFSRAVEAILGRYR